MCNRRRLRVTAAASNHMICPGRQHINKAMTSLPDASSDEPSAKVPGDASLATTGVSTALLAPFLTPSAIIRLSIAVSGCIRAPPSGNIGVRVRPVPIVVLLSPRPRSPSTPSGHRPIPPLPPERIVGTRRMGGVKSKEYSTGGRTAKYGPRPAVCKVEKCHLRQLPLRGQAWEHLTVYCVALVAIGGGVTPDGNSTASTGLFDR